MAKTGNKTVDQYIAQFPPSIQKNLQAIRQTIRKAMPEATEVISYQMPALKQPGFVVYFSAFSDHYSLFIPPSYRVYEAFQQELTSYKVHKATLQLPVTDPVPLGLIARMVRYGVKQNHKH